MADITIISPYIVIICMLTVYVYMLTCPNHTIVVPLHYTYALAQNR